MRNKKAKKNAWQIVGKVLLIILLLAIGIKKTTDDEKAVLRVKAEISDLYTITWKN